MRVAWQIWTWRSCRTAALSFALALGIFASEHGCTPQICPSYLFGPCVLRSTEDGQMKRCVDGQKDRVR